MMSLLLFPFRLAWELVGFVFGVLGLIFSLVVGAVVVFVGLGLTTTVIGAIIGIPLLVLGGMLIVKSLFK